MAEYLTPGVYIEEDLSPRGAAGYGDARAVAAFVGITEKGPALPTKIKSWAQFVTLFGGFAAQGSYLPYAVYMFYKNGGGQCYIVRSARSDATYATVTLKDSRPAGSGGPQDAIKVTAMSPGVGGNTLSVHVVPTGAPAGRFTLIIRNSGREVERFEDLSSNPNDSRYAITIVNSSWAGSLVVRLANLKVSETYVYHPTNDVIPATDAFLGTGSDGVAPYDMVAAAKTLGDLDDNIDLNIPGVISDSIINPVLEWAESTGKVFVVIDGPRGAEGATSSQIAAGYTGLVTGSDPYRATSYGAVYGPWLMCSDPATNMYGAVKLLPPGGVILGRFARNDSVRHVAKAPAGTETKLEGVLAAECKFTPAELDDLADHHINVIRLVPGNGICIMGSRTLKRELPDRYVPVRRTLIMLRKQLVDISKFAVFEPNGPDLWQVIKMTIDRYLLHLLRQGVLAGRNESEAFNVVCSDANNTPQTINAGRVNVDVRVALRYPAEFIVIKVGQWDGQSSVEENF
ncbi:phage tail sheath subtilisin-like domain-containing protein [Nonomuraea sp. SYSU D8015]|uniref:phage tail sheath subtilisin-like domain-containing protein n=1 Tax=Nonomuraea sp. SYSU D8015 TaxID=2593644 RepID=UPI001661506C|nr:phage tail sheath subtilisin-like domain-containing protein [Nonomuraea sp. SYSU D8015]